MMAHKMHIQIFKIKAMLLDAYENNHIMDARFELQYKVVAEL